MVRKTVIEQVVESLFNLYLFSSIFWACNSALLCCPTPISRNLPYLQISLQSQPTTLITLSVRSNSMLLSVPFFRKSKIELSKSASLFALFHSRLPRKTQRRWRNAVSRRKTKKKSWKRLRKKKKPTQRKTISRQKRRHQSVENRSDKEKGPRRD